MPHTERLLGGIITKEVVTEEERKEARDRALAVELQALRTRNTATYHTAGTTSVHLTINHRPQVRIFGIPLWREEHTTSYWVKKATSLSQ